MDAGLSTADGHSRRVLAGQSALIDEVGRGDRHLRLADFGVRQGTEDLGNHQQVHLPEPLNALKWRAF